MPVTFLNIAAPLDLGGHIASEMLVAPLMVTLVAKQIFKNINPKHLDNKMVTGVVAVTASVLGILPSVFLTNTALQIRDQLLDTSSGESDISYVQPASNHRTALDP